ncbi:MAG: hypothetical protein KKF12_09965, partial [Proteobacteria bacterium]|nr:hypothetical protein [Pseudomonadota bacterium]
LAPRQTHSDNEFKPGCEKRFATFYGCVAKSGLKNRELYFRFYATLGLSLTIIKISREYRPGI